MKINLKQHQDIIEGSVQELRAGPFSKAVILSMPGTGKTTLVREINASAEGDLSKFRALDFDLKIKSKRGQRDSSQFISNMLNRDEYDVIFSFIGVCELDSLPEDVPIFIVIPEDMTELAFRSYLRSTVFPAVGRNCDDLISDARAYYNSEIAHYTDNHSLSALSYAALKSLGVDDFTKRYLSCGGKWRSQWLSAARMFRERYPNRIAPVTIVCLPRDKYLSDIFYFIEDADEEML